MLHVRLNLITADPIRLGDSVKFVENEVQPVVESQPGNLGMTLKLNPDIGVAILESFWVSGDALRASERMAAPNRAAAVRRASGTVTVSDSTLLAALRANPSGFYTDRQTTKFPDGAARAQFHQLNHTVATNGVAALQESVAVGSQIYACTPQPDGTCAFTQHDLDAHLTDDILKRPEVLCRSHTGCGSRLRVA